MQSRRCGRSLCGNERGFYQKGHCAAFELQIYRCSKDRLEVEIILEKKRQIFTVQLRLMKTEKLFLKFVLFNTLMFTPLLTAEEQRSLICINLIRLEEVNTTLSTSEPSFLLVFFRTKVQNYHSTKPNLLFLLLMSSGWNDRD